MIWWWAAFFIAGVFAPVDAGVFAASASLVAVAAWGLTAAYRPVLCRFHGRLPAAHLLSRFTITAATSLIVFSAAGLSFMLRYDRCAVQSARYRSNYAYLREGAEPEFDGKGNAGRIFHKPVSAARNHIERAADDARLSKGASAMLRALMLADRSRLDWKTKESFQAHGAAHFLALSGLHVGIIVLILGSTLSALGVPDIPARAFILCAVYLYAAVARFPPSLARAAALYTVIAALTSAGRRTALAEALLGASILLAASNFDILFSAGFQLSFLAVAGIALVAIPMEKAIAEARRSFFRRRPVRIIMMPVAITIAVQLFNLPLILRLYGRVPLYAAAPNILMMVPITILLCASLVFIAVPYGPSRTLLAAVISWLSGSIGRIPSLFDPLSSLALHGYRTDLLFYTFGLACICAALRKGRNTIRFLPAGLLMIGVSLSGLSGTGPGERWTGDRDLSWCGRRCRFEYVCGRRDVLIIRGELEGVDVAPALQRLWKNGTPRVFNVIYCGPLCRDTAALSVLIGRLSCTELICNPLLMSQAPGLSSSVGEVGAEITAAESPAALDTGESDVLIEPPVTPCRKGRSAAFSSSSIACKVRKHVSYNKTME